MKRYNRGTAIPFTHTFKDSSGAVAFPSSARVTIAYPTTGFPYRSSGYETTYVNMTTPTTVTTADLYGVWSATWETQESEPIVGSGHVFYSIRSNNLALGVTDGSLDLRANPANISILSTT